MAEVVGSDRLEPCCLGSRLEHAPTPVTPVGVTPRLVVWPGEDQLLVIRPAPRWPHLDFAELWHYREVLWTIVWRDVKVRYKQTFLGIAWAFLVPIFTATIYVIVFGKFAKFPSGNVSYPSLVVAGVIPMQYFASALNTSSMSLVTNLTLVTKVDFPRVLLPLSAVVVPIVDLVVGLPVLLALMAMYGTWPKGAQVVTAPAFILLALVTNAPVSVFVTSLSFASYLVARFVAGPALRTRAPRGIVAETS